MQLFISIVNQTLTFFDETLGTKTYLVSTAKKGAGERMGSYMTPRGWHKIRAKIGDGQPINTVFVSRRPTGECYNPQLAKIHSNRDWILSRILWLSGLEPGVNRFGEVDSQRRYIYIHGTSDEASLGNPVSNGCIRMRNRDLVELFDLVKPGTLVFISEKASFKPMSEEKLIIRNPLLI